MKVKPFARHGFYTIIDNALLDHVMPALSHTAWKVLCVILRWTRGNMKHDEGLSYGDLKRYSGIRSDATIAKVLAELGEGQGEHQGWQLIECVSVGTLVNGLDYSKSRYRINVEFEIEISTSKNEAGPASKNEVGSTSKNEAGPTSKNEEIYIHSITKELQRDARTRATRSPGKKRERGKPSEDEVAAYFTEIGHPAQARTFWLYYESNGWRGVRDWKAKALLWLERDGLRAGAPAAKVLYTHQEAMQEWEKRGRPGGVFPGVLFELATEPGQKAMYRRRE